MTLDTEIDTNAHDDDNDADDGEGIEQYHLAKIGIKIAPFIPDDIEIGDCFVYMAGARHKYLDCGVLTGYKLFPKTLRIYYKTKYGENKYFVSAPKPGIIYLDIIKVKNIAFMIDDDRMRTLYKQYMIVNEKLGVKKDV
jgi:hypothetical protein